MWFLEPAKTLFDQRCVRQNPSVDGAVVDFKSPLQEHLLQVPIAQRIAQIPGHCPTDQLGFNLSASEVILRLAFQFVGNRSENHDAELQILERSINCQISRQS